MVGSRKKFITNTILSFHDYLNEIKKAVEQIKQNSNAEFFIFRGQSVDEDLLPKIGRKDYIKPKMNVLEKGIFNEFRRLSIPFIEKTDLSEWEALALAQHHYLPTRLLDWTENPLTALWFAFNEKNADQTKRVVWCFGFNKNDILEQSKMKCFTNDRTIVYQPNHITRRLINQTGWFTCHFYNETKNKYSALNNLRNHWNHLYRIRFANKSEEFRGDVLSQLNTFGINHYSVFPDLEGLSKYLDWKTFQE
jgi:hypothetical protein